MKRRRTIFLIICGIRLAHVITVVDANSHSLRVRTEATESRSGAGWMEVAGDSARICSKKNVPLQEGLINDVRLEDCEACTSQEHLNVCSLHLTLVQS